MWKQIKILLVILSVALNVAFAGVWIVHVTASRVPSCENRCVPDDSGSVWCPLHRELNVSAEQWKQIEPRLRAFRASADKICRRIGGQRAEIIALLAAREPDLTAVEAKLEAILAGQRQMQELVIEQLIAEKEILTPQQQQRFFDMLRRRSGCNHRGPLLVPGRGIDGVGRTLRSNEKD